MLFESGGGPPADPPADPPAPTPPAPSSPPPGKTFTQEQVDKMVQERLARQKAQFSDYEELKSESEEYRKLKESQQSDTEKLLARAEAAEAAAAKAQEDSEAAAKAREEALSQANKTLRKSAIISAAAAQSAIDPSEVYALLMADDYAVHVKDDDGEMIEFKVTLDDDGQVTGAEDTVEALLAIKQHLVGGSPTPRPGPGDGGTSTTPVTEPDLGAEDDPQKVREMARGYNRR
jgi:hypothetical protein